MGSAGGDDNDNRLVRSRLLSADNSTVPTSKDETGGSPFDAIRRLDAYGREYWDARELQPLMGYEQWRRFEDAIARAIRAAKNTSTYSDSAFAQVTQLVNAGNLGQQKRANYHLSRYAAYLVAMNGDPGKPEVAASQAYFAVRAREAELGAIAQAEIRQTALARAREMVDYRLFRDMMAENATDYEPSSKATRIFFGAMQNKLYRHLTGMTADEIKKARTIQTWPGIDEGKPEPSAKSAARKVAKNYLTAKELGRLNRMVGRLCLAAEEIAEDGVALSLAQWDDLLDSELAMSSRRMLAA